MGEKGKEFSSFVKSEGSRGEGERDSYRGRTGGNTHLTEEYLQKEWGGAKVITLTQGQRGLTPTNQGTK